MELRATTRTVFGKRVKGLRREGVIPAEMFGHNIPNLHLSVHEKDFVKIYRTAGENTVVDLITEDGGKNPVLILNVERDSISQKILAVNLYRVRMDEKIKTKVPINFEGEAPAEKNSLVVVKVLDEIEIEALPQDIPHRFTVSLSTLQDLGQSISVKDLQAPHGVHILSNPGMVIVTISERAKEEVAPPPTTEAPVAAEAAEPTGGETGETKPAPQAPQSK